MKNDETTNKSKIHLETTLRELKRDLEQEKWDHLNDVSEKEREKIQATESLKEDMKTKIKETQANLKALNEE